MKKHSFSGIFLTILFISSCNLNAPEPAATCTDGIWNQDETEKDCGGVCPACPTCIDGIQNQGELGPDCGGPCTMACLGVPPCTPTAGTFKLGSSPVMVLTTNSHHVDMNGDFVFRFTGSGFLIDLTFSRFYNFLTGGMFEMVQWLEQDATGMHQISIRVETSLVYNLTQGDAYVGLENGTFTIIVCNARTSNQNITTYSDGHFYFPDTH